MTYNYNPGEIRPAKNGTINFQNRMLRYAVYDSFVSIELDLHIAKIDWADFLNAMKSLLFDHNLQMRNKDRITVNTIGGNGGITAVLWTERLQSIQRI